MNKEFDQLPNVMTAKEVAAYLKMSPEWGYQTIQRMARQGKIKGVQIGDLWRFTRQQVETFLNNGKSR